MYQGEMSAQNSEQQRRVVGRPWPKGTSGNPGGRTKKLRELDAEIERLHAGQNVLDVLERLREIAMGHEIEVSKGEDGPVVAYAVTKVQVEAAKVYLNRVMGPVAPNQHAGDVDDVEGRSLEELLAEAQSLIAGSNAQ